MSDSPDMRRCSRCGKKFASRNAADQHIADKHKGIGERVTVLRDEEPSLADEFIEAQESGTDEPEYLR